jgi:hypothetical protein
LEFSALACLKTGTPQRKALPYAHGDRGREEKTTILENRMKTYFPFVAHFFSPARRLAPLPFLSGRFRKAAKRISAFSLLVRGGGTKGFSATGAGASPSSGGKSWIDHEDFIERQMTDNV